jgi:F-type H+-transporting ATPase subunit delta
MREGPSEGRLKDTKLATRYARALHAALRDPKENESAERFLTTLAAAIEESPELRSTLRNPAVRRAAKKDALYALAIRAGAGEFVGRFLRVIVDNRRIRDLSDIAAAYHAEREKAQGILPVTLTSAAPLAADMVAKVRTSLERLTGRTIRLSSNVDPSLLGGVVTRVGSTVYDGSLRTQLADLRRCMVEE